MTHKELRAFSFGENPFFLGLSLTLVSEWYQEIGRNPRYFSLCNSRYFVRKIRKASNCEAESLVTLHNKRAGVI
jgi:hypothetical protein